MSFFFLLLLLVGLCGASSFQYPFNQIKRVNNHGVHFNLDAVCQMVKAKNYHNKLLNIKRDMTNLHEKAAKLKVRQRRLLNFSSLCVMGSFQKQALSVHFVGGRTRGRGNTFRQNSLIKKHTLLRSVPFLSYLNVNEPGGEGKFSVTSTFSSLCVKGSFQKQALSVHFV